MMHIAYISRKIEFNFEILNIRYNHDGLWDILRGPVVDYVPSKYSANIGKVIFNFFLSFKLDRLIFNLYVIRFQNYIYIIAMYFFSIL